MANDEILNDENMDLERIGKSRSRLRIAVAIALLILIVGVGLIAAESGVRNSLNIVSPSSSNGPSYTIIASPNVHYCRFIGEPYSCSKWIFWVFADSYSGNNNC
jgi:hypothetical protein